MVEVLQITISNKPKKQKMRNKKPSFRQGILDGFLEVQISDLKQNLVYQHISF